jgi:uncharacterized membrane protein YccC
MLTRRAFLAGTVLGIVAAILAPHVVIAKKPDEVFEAPMLPFMLPA